MFGWIYEMLMSIVHFVLGLFGIQWGEKHVRFEDGVAPEKDQESVKEAPSPSQELNQLGDDISDQVVAN